MLLQKQASKQRAAEAGSRTSEEKKKRRVDSGDRVKCVHGFCHYRLYDTGIAYTPRKVTLNIDNLLARSCPIHSCPIHDACL